ncbi:copper resistance protein CopC [Erwinia endophytica]|uniref:copper homeostasis periplasmic binding protein CopC n=1 Tax=Erwinia endophytica TaxID=1563158 RepID=UPI001265F635|nr:copper homeostasis periplasmic binding protein CopC [Erwinia endophytica]KAB8307526.1 copper resistance protein CopC [Erwinia endophytica]
MFVHLKKAIATAAVLATLIVSQQALAHAHLASAVPADKAVISTSPTALTLTFTEGVEPNFSGVMLIGADGAMVSTGKLSVDKADNKVATVPLNAPLKAGSYVVDWHVLSVDGHKTKGSYNFTLK